MSVLLLNSQIENSQLENENLYLSHDGGDESALVIHPAIHTRLSVWLSLVCKGLVQMKELPLWVGEATALFWPQVWVQWDGDSQKGIFGEELSVIVGDSVIVKDVDPAAMIRDGPSEVLQ